MYYTLKQSAEFLGLGIESTKRLIQDSHIPAIVTPSRKNPKRMTYRIDDAALRQFKRSKATMMTNGHTPQAQPETNGNHGTVVNVASAIPPPTPVPEGYQTVAAVRDMLDTTDSFMYDRIKNGTVEAPRINGRMMLSPESIEILKARLTEFRSRGSKRNKFTDGHREHGIKLLDLPVTQPSAGARMLTERLAERQQEHQQTQTRLQSLERQVAELQGVVAKLVDGLGGL